MGTTTTDDLAERVLAVLRAHEAELRAAGVAGLSLFGSIARGDAEGDSDVDLAAELDPEARIGLFALGALEGRLSELVGRRVDLLPEPVEKARLQASIDRDRRRGGARSGQRRGTRSRSAWMCDGQACGGARPAPTHMQLRTGRAAPGAAGFTDNNGRGVPIRGAGPPARPVRSAQERRCTGVTPRAPPRVEPRRPTSRSRPG